jgi:hypothetical protein
MSGSTADATQARERAVALAANRLEHLREALLLPAPATSAAAQAAAT